MTTVITLSIAIVLITLIFCITFLVSRLPDASKDVSDKQNEPDTNEIENNNDKHAFDHPVNSELSDEQVKSLISLKDQVKSFKLQVKINELDELVSKLNSADFPENEKLALADEIADKVDITLQGDKQAQDKKQKFKVIQGWGASMRAS
ncbi:hypothetical protein [Fangia hongkongensis]|uniref:hypothetical protein n=1 Tax=Fangia hongkongensis TaxID=270495 RepID=UPI000382CA7E|nr:hypothetical protein [Fangia hongkongensis]MBK2124422.1 hypothetical protein [Fangia hongkongensis]